MYQHRIRSCLYCRYAFIIHKLRLISLVKQRPMIAKMLVKNMKKFRQPLLQASVSLISNRNNIAVLNFSRNFVKRRLHWKDKYLATKSRKNQLPFARKKGKKENLKNKKKKKKKENKRHLIRVFPRFDTDVKSGLLGTEAMKFNVSLWSVSFMLQLTMSYICQHELRLVLVTVTTTARRS